MPNISLTALGTRGFVIKGAAGADRAGVGVASAGDVNGDGIDDFIIGAPQGAGVDGRAFVLYGKTGGWGPVDLSTLAPSSGFVIQGELAGVVAANLGASVSSAGDVNGDGIDDLIVGARYASQAFVVFGKAGGLGNIDLASLAPADGFAISAPAVNQMGISVSSAGDFNNDGFDDIIVGAPLANANTGEAYVIFGKASGFGPVDCLNLGTGGLTFYGNNPSDLVGWSVSSTGDINGDGFDDVIVGGRDYASNVDSEAYVIFGRAVGPGSISVVNLLPSDGFAIVGEQDNAQTGWSVSSAGDMNGDGLGDFIVGAPDYDDGAIKTGRAYVIFGKTEGYGTLDLSALGVHDGFVITGRADPSTSTGALGSSVASAGDHNGDGYDDLIISGRFTTIDNGDPSEIFVIYGKAGGFGAIDLDHLTASDAYILQGSPSADGTGASVSSAGDINGDGFSDLIIGAPYSDVGGTNAGEAYVVFGVAPTTSVTRIGSIIDQAIRGGLGDDYLDGRDGADRLFGADGADQMIGGTGNDQLFGGSDDDRLTGGSGEDRLEGDDGDDTLIGEGSADDLLGGEGFDFIDGGSGNDRVDGGDGDDEMRGGSGINTLSYASAAASVTVSLALLGWQDTIGAGVDMVRNFQNLSGSVFDDSLTGDAQANRLEGGGGSDSMAGGFGNDLYIVDGGDTIVEADAAGTDLVQSSVTCTLAENVENLTLTGAAAINGTGNDLTNLLLGNTAANNLNGGAGADEMRGGAGNDVYVVDNAGDIALEGSGNGTDRVESSVSVSLGANFENLTLTGLADINATGNGQANILLGNGGANQLNGGTGADEMRGGAGNDLYFVDNAGDVVVEAGNNGTDTVNSSVGFTLGTGLENLILTGASAISGTGNGAANAITGNNAANILSGGIGADTLIGGGGADDLYGGAGHDDLTGGAGADKFRFDTALSAASNVDDILDFSVIDDTIFFDRDIFTGIAADGTLAAGAFRAGAAAADADDRIVYNAATGQIFYDSDGSGAAAQALFATVTAGTALTNADFAGYI